MPEQLHAQMDLIVNGTLYTLILFSIVTWVLVIYKIWQFNKNAQSNESFNQAFWNAKDLTEAERMCSANDQGTQARLAQAGFGWLAQLRESEQSIRLKFRGDPRDLLEQYLRRHTQDEQGKLELGLTMLASIGSTAPFVGLFGTVVGIMHAMHQISATGSSSLEVVAGPIGDALIATAIGIAVAVPAVLAYNFFIRKAKQQRATLETFAEGFLHIAFPERV
jgi:biopolymer transport protein ExbB